MKIYGMEKLSLVDFDGKITCTIFTGGCNFACPFCHNSSLVLNAGLNQELPFSEVVDYLTLRRKMVDAVCITGGEPTLYNDLKDYFKLFKDMGFITKLDTNGTNPKMLKELVEEGLVDYVAMDVKNSYTNYAKTIGKDDPKLLDKVKESINYLLEDHVDYEFRTTIVNELHQEADFLEIAKMLKGAKRYYLQKFKDSKYCIKQGLHEVKLDDAKKYLEILRKDLNDVNLRGY